jgi:hypothetical protein
MYCDVLRHCRHRSDGLILYSQSQSHVVTITYDYCLHCWLFSPWRLAPDWLIIWLLTDNSLGVGPLDLPSRSHQPQPFRIALFWVGYRWNASTQSQCITVVAVTIFASVTADTMSVTSCPLNGNGPLQYVCMYVCMCVCVCKGWAIKPSPAPRPSMIYYAFSLVQEFSSECEYFITYLCNTKMLLYLLP